MPKTKITFGVQGGSGAIVARTGGKTAINSGTVVLYGETVREGESLTFTATPSVGYEVSHWIVNGEAVQFPGRVFIVPELQVEGGRYHAEVILQAFDPTAGRFDPCSALNNTNRGLMGMNLGSRNDAHAGFATIAGLDSTFTEAYLASLAPFGLLRFMDFTSTNNHVLINDWNATEETMWGEVIALANTTRADIWVCIPVNANDSYIQALAELMHRHLNPYTKVYVEWGNEVWGFEAQQKVNRKMAEERGIPNDNRHIYDTHQNWWLWPDYFHFAQRTAEIAFIFRSVFGEDDRPIDTSSRVRPVLTWQIMPNAFAPMVEWLQGTTHTPNISDPKFRNPHEYIWAVGIAPYFQEPHTVLANDVDTIHHFMLNSIEGQMEVLKSVVDNAAAAGFIGGAITYEGGPHYQGGGEVGLTNLGTRTKAQKHPIMVDLMNYYITNAWFGLGGSTYTHFSHLGASMQWGHWGCKDNLSLEQFQTAAKYLSLVWVSRQPRGTTVSRPSLPLEPPFANPILNPSFENANPGEHWNLGVGWSVCSGEATDGQQSLLFDGLAEGISETRSRQFTLSQDTDFILSFWHKGAGNIAICGKSGEIVAKALKSEGWVEYLLPLFTGNDMYFEIKLTSTLGEKARFDFFNIDKNHIVNPSFERGIAPWAHGLGWIGEQPHVCTTEQAANGTTSLKIFGEITPEGLNSNQFTLQPDTEYRLCFDSMGDGGFTAVTAGGAVEITTKPSDGWVNNEICFNTSGFSTLTGNLRISTASAISATYVDNFILAVKRVTVS